MASAKLVFDTRRAKEDGTYPITIRITHQRVSLPIPTGYSCSKEQWDKDNLEIRKSKSYPDFRKHNTDIAQKLTLAKTYISTNDKRLYTLSCKQLRNEILNTTPGGDRSSQSVMSIKEGVDLYVRHLNNIDVPEHKVRDRTKKYIGEVQQILDFLLTLMDPDTSLSNITDKHAGLFFKAVMRRPNKTGGKIKSRTFNLYITCVKQMFNFFQDKKYDCANPFKEIELRRTKNEPKMVYLEEFYELLEKIGEVPERQTYIYKTATGRTRIENKQMFKPWLKHAIMLSLFGGGRRREEIARLKWTSVIPNDKKLIGGILYYRNLKVERQSNIQFEDEQLPVEVPITKQLAKLLIEMGWNKNKGTDQYIIAPEVTRREAVMDALTKGFQHYYKQTSNPRPGISFKCLRKTYITYARAILMDRAKDVTGHTTNKMIEAHYEDKKLSRQKLTKSLKF